MRLVVTWWSRRRGGRPAVASTAASYTASSYGVYYGGGATTATGVYCQFSEGDSRLCRKVHRAARQSPERRETPGEDSCSLNNQAHVTTHGFQELLAPTA
jgi:hypothetical protein